MMTDLIITPTPEEVDAVHFKIKQHQQDTQ